MGWLLDADVLSQPAKSQGNRGGIAWLEREQDACYTSTFVIAQIAYWVRTKDGRRRTQLQQWLHRSVEALEGRIPSVWVQSPSPPSRQQGGAGTVLTSSRDSSKLDTVYLHFTTGTVASDTGIFRSSGSGDMNSLSNPPWPRCRRITESTL